MGLLLTLSEPNEAGRSSWLVVMATHEKAKIKATDNPKMNKIRFNVWLAAKFSYVIYYTRALQ